MSNWSTSDGMYYRQVMRYRKSRLPVGIYLPLVLFLLTASLAAGWPSQPGSWVANFLLAVMLLIQFRLWDDLSDVPRDRLDHPDRVLCEARSLAPFQWLLAVVFALNLTSIALVKSVPVFVAFLALNLIMFAWYQLIDKTRVPALIRHHFVLIKYPAFVYFLSPSQNGTNQLALVYAMCLVFLCFCVYEALHDQRLHSCKGINLVLAAELVTLVLFATLILIDLCSVAEMWAVIQAAMALTGAVVFVFLFQRHRQHTAPGRWCYIVFLIGFVWLLNYSLANRTPVAFSDRPAARCFYGETIRIAGKADTSVHRQRCSDVRKSASGPDSIISTFRTGLFS